MSDTFWLAFFALGSDFIKNGAAIIAAIAGLGALWRSHENSKIAKDLKKETEENTKITLETNKKAKELIDTTVDIKTNTNSHLEKLHKKQEEADQKIVELQRMINRMLDGGDTSGIMDSAISRPDAPSNVPEEAISTAGLVITSESFEEGAISAKAIAPDAVEKIADAVISRNPTQPDPSNPAADL